MAIPTSSENSKLMSSSSMEEAPAQHTSEATAVNKEARAQPSGGAPPRRTSESQSVYLPSSDASPAIQPAETFETATPDLTEQDVAEDGEVFEDRTQTVYDGPASRDEDVSLENSDAGTPIHDASMELNELLQEASMLPIEPGTNGNPMDIDAELSSLAETPKPRSPSPA